MSELDVLLAEREPGGLSWNRVKAFFPENGPMDKMTWDRMPASYQQLDWDGMRDPRTVPEGPIGVSFRLSTRESMIVEGDTPRYLRWGQAANLGLKNTFWVIENERFQTGLWTPDENRHFVLNGVMYEWDRSPNEPSWIEVQAARREALARKYVGFTYLLQFVAPPFAGEKIDFRYKLKAAFNEDFAGRLTYSSVIDMLEVATFAGNPRIGLLKLFYKDETVHSGWYFDGTVDYFERADERKQQQLVKSGAKILENADAVGDELRTFHQSRTLAQGIFESPEPVVSLNAKRRVEAIDKKYNNLLGKYGGRTDINPATRVIGQFIDLAA